MLVGRLLSRLFFHQSTGRSTKLLLCTKLCMSVDRATDRPLFWLHTDCVLAPIIVWSLHYLFRCVKKTLSSIFYLLSPYSSLSRWRFLKSELNSTQCMSTRNKLNHVAAYVPCPRDQVIRSSSKRAPPSQATGRIWNISLQCVNFTPEITLVSVSVGFSFVWTFSNSMSPSSRISQTKWNLASMCFVLTWYT